MANISIYEAISRNLGDCLVKGVPTNATATSFMSNALVHPDSNQIRGNEVYFFTGGGAGQARTISSFTPGSNHVIVDPAFDTIPSANSQFLLFNYFATEDYENSINRAMGKVRLMNLQSKVATLQLVATQYEYPVPSGFEFISTLRLVPSGNTDYENSVDVDTQFEFPPRFWRIDPNAQGSQVIIFDVRKLSLDDYNKEWVNVVGQVKPDFTATLVDETLQEYVIAQASALLASQRVTEGKGGWQSKFGVFRDMANSLEPYIRSHAYGKRVGQ